MGDGGSVWEDEVVLEMDCMMVNNNVKVLNATDAYT